MNKYLPKNTVIQFTNDNEIITIPYKKNSLIKFFAIPCSWIGILSSELLNYSKGNRQ